MTNQAIAPILAKIRVIRGQRVMLDADLARLYGVTTRRLNEQVRRNSARFPGDFVFRIEPREWAEMLSQNATTWHRRRRLDRLPLAFTEYGCLMLSNVLRSQRAIKVSVLIVRAFVTLRGAISANTELATRIDELSAELARHRSKLSAHDATILKLLADIRRLTGFPEQPRREIGYTADWTKR
jgi:ORF6N domain-containing protein